MEVYGQPDSIWGKKRRDSKDESEKEWLCFWELDLAEVWECKRTISSSVFERISPQVTFCSCKIMGLG